MANFVEDIAEYVRTAYQHPVHGLKLLEELKETYRHETEEDHRLRFYDDGTSIAIRLPSLRDLAYAYNQETRGGVREDIRTVLDTRYHYIGTADRAFYVQDDDTYMLDEGDETLIRRIDRIQSEYSLDDLVADYRWMRDRGELEGAQEFWSKNRELFRAGETGVTEVFYDQMRGQVYLFDREAITIEEADDEILGELDVIDIPERQQTIMFDSEETVFEQLFGSFDTEDRYK